MAGDSDDRGPGTGDRGQLRAAHADREHVVGVLKTAYVRGMLDKDEFDQRVGRAFAGRTYAELDAVTGDLPADLPAAAPLAVPALAGEPDEGWLTVKRAVIISACLLIPTALATVIGFALTARFHNQALTFFPVLAFFFATAISTPLITEARHRQRSRPRPPRAPTDSGREPTGGSRPRQRRRSTGRDLTLAVAA